jgi:hypothetical protein
MCRRPAVLCARCCRASGGCERHVLPGAAPLPLSQQQIVAPTGSDPAPPGQQSEDAAAAQQGESSSSPSFQLDPRTLQQLLAAFQPMIQSAVTAALSDRPSPSSTSETTSVPRTSDGGASTANSTPGSANGYPYESLAGFGLLGQTPPLATPSHRSAYPPLMNKSTPAELLASAQAASQVSSQTSHNTSVLQHSPIGDNSCVNIYNNHLSGSTPPAARALGLDPELASSVFATLPPGVRPVRPSLTGKTPRSAAELATHLNDWLAHESSLARDHDKYVAMDAYIKRTVDFAYKTNVHQALEYHHSAVNASTHRPPLWDPQVHGPVYAQGFAEHISPYLKARLKTSGTVTGSTEVRGSVSSKAPNSRNPTSDRKRSQPSSTGSGPQDKCSYPGHEGLDHRNEQCHKQKANKKAKTETAAAGTASSG